MSASTVKDGVGLVQDAFSIDAKSAIIIVLFLVIVGLVIYIPFSKAFDRIKALEKKVNKGSFKVPKASTFSATGEIHDNPKEE